MPRLLLRPPREDPAADHEGQLDQLRQSLNATTAKVRLTDCLGVCEQCNVHDLKAIDDITTWITAGGPGLADPPTALDLYEFTPSRRIRNDAGLGQAP